MQLTNRRVHLMGTVIDVSIYHKQPEPLLDQVEALLNLYNKRFSANDDSSELMKINKAAGLHPVKIHPCYRSIRGKSKRLSPRKRHEN